MNVLGSCLKSLLTSPVSSGLNCQVRYKWTDWRMLRDYKRRQMLIKLNPERVRINTIRKNDILPRELREIADQEIADMPRDSMYTRVNNRCCLTSRPRGVFTRFRASRIMFRHLADYNKLSGVQRGLW